MLFVIMFFGWYAFLGDCQPPNFTLPIRIPPILLDNAETIDRSCPSQSTDDIVDKEWTKTREILKNLYKPCNCGGPDWTSVLYLNMSDPDNSCPSNWKLHESPIRGCGRKTDDIFTCDSVRIPVNINYSMICGRIYACQRGESRAFRAGIFVPIENSYVSGLSLTHGAVGKRKHVWTFVSAWDETSIRITPSYSCPCIDSTYNWTYQLPSCVGDSYFCDTGTHTFYDRDRLKVFKNDPLWDGEGCGGSSTCCSFNNPPWFCKYLKYHTTDNLELRLCLAWFPRYEDFRISLVEIYVK